MVLIDVTGAAKYIKYAYTEVLHFEEEKAVLFQVRYGLIYHTKRQINSSGCFLGFFTLF